MTITITNDVELEKTDGDTPGSAAAGDIAERIPDAHQWAEIQKARRRERSASDRVESLKVLLKFAKEEHEHASDALGKLLDEVENPTLFTGVKPSVTRDELEKFDESTFTPAAPEAWRSVSINDLDLDVKIAAKLTDAGYATLGALADFTSDPRNGLLDIPGIGEKSADQIEERLMTYWASHPIEKPAAAAEPVAVLKWLNEELVGTIYATNTAGIEVDADVHADFVIAQDGEKFDVSDSDSGLLPDENPGEFDTLDAAKAWCEARNAALVAAKAQPSTENETPPVNSSSDFDDDKIGKSETVVNVPKTLVISVAQRAGGRWASDYFAAASPKTQISAKLDGHHASRAAAITHAADAVHQWLKEIIAGSLGKTAANAKEIKKALDKLDKSLAGEAGGARDDNAEAVKQELATA